jgi:hypothetical protein
MKMMNQSIADISIFESLQSDQHARTGVSQMSVFNDLAAVKGLADKYKSMVNSYINSHIPKAKAVYDEYRDAVKKQGMLKPDDPLHKKMREALVADHDMKQKIVEITAQIKKEAAKETRDVNKSLDADEPNSRDRMTKTNAVYDEIQKAQRLLQEQVKKFDMWFDSNGVRKF